MSRVTVTNPYDLLTDENEDRTNVPAPKKEQKPAAPTPKVAAKPAPKVAASKPAAPKTETKAAPKPAAQGVAKNSAPQTVKPAPPRDSNQNLQERDKESRAPRDKRDHQPHPAGARKDKRPFDRKSGTGRPANENKKSGQGKANWGGEVDAKEGVEALKDKEDKVEEEKEGEETKDEKVTEEKKEGEVKDETPKEKEEFTLDEYLAKRKGKTPVVAALEPRKVNAEDFNAAGLVPLQRGEVGDAPLAKKDKKAAEKAAPKEDKPAAEKKERENLAAKLLNFSSHQEERAKDRRSSYRREESGPRPQGGERRAPRNPNPNPRGPRPDAKGAQPPVQEKDFPSLSGDAVKA